MIYKSFQNIQLPTLGMGTMRLPVIDGDYSKIDEVKTAEMVEFAMKNGINYFDTAWGYHEKQSETVMGRVLSKYPRESFFLASKFPGFYKENMEKIEEIFETQLQKCQVEYFDFYLVHSVGEGNIDTYLDPKYGLLDYLIKQKENGRIRHLGFSIHAEFDTMMRFMDVYGPYMEFCQIQLNYFDWTFQDAKRKVEYLREKKIPIWVMEPVRGGRLAALREDYEQKLRAARPEEGIPAWAFRFLQSIPEVVVTLSGMSNYEQVADNIRTFSEEKPLNAEEWDLLQEIVVDMRRDKNLECTNCKYCTTQCPMELDIPDLIKLYNKRHFNGTNFTEGDLSKVDSEKWPTACIACRACEEVCPQQIKISEVMADFASRIQK